jgi:hypothetical protein
VTYGITERMKDIQKVFQELEAVARRWQGDGGKVAVGATEHSAQEEIQA